MAGTVLQVMNYAASYRGNFMDSLRCLDEKIEKEGLKNIYLFCKEAKESDAFSWINQMINEGNSVDFLSENTDADAKLIKRLIKEKNVRIIHTHFITMPQYLAVLKATMFSNIPVVMHFHNHSVEAHNFVKNTLRRKLYKKCRMVACSESVLNSLKRDYPGNRKCYVDNGVNFSRLDSFSTITDEEYGIDEGEKTILIFGFDFYRKGVDLAVKAVHELRQEGHKLSLLISLSRNFEFVESNIVDMLGSLPKWVKIIKARNDVASLYNYVDMFISPSREEGLPYSVVEAGYSNCGVVVSDISAQVNLKLKYATWFQNENVDELKRAILEELEKSRQKKDDMEAVKAYMMEQYSLEQWADKIKTIYIEELQRDEAN